MPAETSAISIGSKAWVIPKATGFSVGRTISDRTVTVSAGTSSVGKLAEPNQEPVSPAIGAVIDRLSECLLGTLRMTAFSCLNPTAAVVLPSLLFSALSAPSWTGARAPETRLEKPG